MPPIRATVVQSVRSNWEAAPASGCVATVMIRA